MMPPRTGDLLLCSGTSIWSRLVRLVTRSPYSHVAIIVCPPGLPALVLESIEWYGVRATVLAHWHHRGAVTHARVDVPFDAERMTRWCVEQLGRPYNWREVVEIAARLLLRLPELITHRGWICSEYVRAAYREAGVDLAPGRYCTPGDIGRDARVRLMR